MKQNTYRKSLAITRQSSFQDDHPDLNCSVQLSSSLRMEQFREYQSMSLSGSFLMNQTSLMFSRVNDCDLKYAKKKIGVQLSILQRNILGESNENVEKPRRLNRSGFIKNKQNEAPKPTKITSTSLSQLLTSKKTSVQQSNPNPNPNPTTITSTDLQQIRKIDKDIYKLYMDLYHDEKQQQEKKRDRDTVIGQLRMEIQRERKKELELEGRIGELRGRQREVEEETRNKEGDWLRNVRGKLWDNFEY